MLNIASNTTNTPVKRKSRLANVPDIYEVSHPTQRSPGAVPRANAIMVSAPVIALPVVIAYVCIARVKPQGRKNVRAPVERAVMCFEVFSLFAMSDLKNLGRVIDIRESLGDISASFTPSESMIIHVIMVIPPIINGESETNEPNTQRSPPKSPNPIIRPILK